MVIRKYKQSDLSELLDVWLQANAAAHPFMDEAFIKKEKDNIRDLYLPNTITWVYPNKDGLDGFISMMGNEVGAIFVRPEKHGLGFGKALMDHVSQIHKELEVEVFKNNKIGRAFYNRYGFKFMREYIHEETGMVVLRMKYMS